MCGKPTAKTETSGGAQHRAPTGVNVDQNAALVNTWGRSRRTRPIATAGFGRGVNAAMRGTNGSPNVMSGANEVTNSVMGRRAISKH